MPEKILIVGGVALGPKAASRCKRLMPDAEVTLVDETVYISYGGCGIPYYVSGEINSLDALRSTTYGTVRTPEYFEHKGVHTLNQTRVTAIDRASKTVTAKNLVWTPFCLSESRMGRDTRCACRGRRPRPQKRGRREQP